MFGANIGIPELIIVLSVALALVAIPVACAVFVYVDAKKRGLNAALWALLAFFTNIVGVAVYLLARPGEASRCGKCGAPISNGFVVCPVCGNKLPQTCPSCGRALRAEWRLCPYCGREAGAAEAPRPAPVAPRRISGLAVGALISTLVAPVAWMLLRVGMPFGAGFINPRQTSAALRFLVEWSFALALWFPAIAVVLAVAALVKIARRPSELGGTWAAVLALVLNGTYLLIAAAASVAWIRSLL